MRMPGADSIDGKFCRITAILSFPQIPQLDEIVPKRCAELSLGFMPSARVTVMMFSRLRAADGREKTGSEFFVVPGCSHRSRNSLAADANLERLFNGEIVVMIFQCAILLSPN